MTQFIRVGNTKQGTAYKLNRRGSVWLVPSCGFCSCSERCYQTFTYLTKRQTTTSRHHTRE